MKRYKYIVLGSVFITCFIIGHMAGRALGSTEEYQIIDESPFSPDSQRLILILGVDNLENEPPNLVSIWLALYLPDLSSLSLVPIFPPSSQSISMTVEDLIQNFSLSSDQKLSKSFIKQLNKAGVHWDNYLIADEYGWTELSVILQGIDTGSSILPITISKTNSLNNNIDPEIIVSGQAYIFQQLCLNLVSTALPINISTMDETRHLLTDLSIPDITDYGTSGTTPGRNIQCKFPTMSH